MFVATDGRLAHVRSGKSGACLTEQNKSSTVNLVSQHLKQQLRRSTFPSRSKRSPDLHLILPLACAICSKSRTFVKSASERWLTIFELTTSASILAGHTSLVRTNVRNAATLYLVTSSTATNATFELAGDAGRTDCETLSSLSGCFEVRSPGSVGRE